MEEYINLKGISPFDKLITKIWSRRIYKFKMKEKIRQIKYFRMKSEERFLINILNEMVEVKSDKYPCFIFYKYKDDIIFEYNSKNGYFWVSYSKIWSVLESKFKFNYQEICYLIKVLMEDYINLMGITPLFDEIYRANPVEEYINLRANYT